MSYQINFSDTQNKQPLTVFDNTVNTDTSLTIPGRNQRGYAVSIAEDFLHLLENFANTTAPSSPIEGQVWYDSSTGTHNLKVYDGTTWKPVGSVNKGSERPTNVLQGDLWVDTVNQQLYLYNGSSWILVGPEFSGGLKTGIKAESLQDSEDKFHTVLKTYIDDRVVSIYSASSFIPKINIDGFAAINSGVNITTVDFSSLGNSPTKYWGVAEKAENLLIGSTTVAASNFLRKDIPNTTNYPLTVKSDQGILTGGSGQIQISVDSGSIANIYNATANSAFDIRVKNSFGKSVTLIRADSSQHVGIGPDNFTPGATLDVKGNSIFSDILKITSTAGVGDVSGPALQVTGGAIVKAGIATTSGSFTQVTMGQLPPGSAPSSISSDVLLPATDSTLNIGRSDLKFNNVYAKTFIGNFTGTITGSVNGDASGSASKLKSSTTFQMIGDVTSSGFSFDGTGTTVKTFTTSINSNIIHSRNEITSVAGSDELLLYKSSTGTLGKMTRATFFTNTALIPIGTILPFAGVAAPAGFLFCDGSEKSRIDYPELFQVILYTYGNPTQLRGTATFRLPDLRGKFALGCFGMSNGDLIQSPLGPISSGTQAPSGTTQSTATQVGNTNGTDAVQLKVENVPNHKHDLKGDQGGQYYTINNLSGSPKDANGFTGNGPNVAGQGQYYPRTGDMIGGIKDVSGNPNPKSVGIMNPYVTINYIIFTGKFV